MQFVHATCSLTVLFTIRNACWWTNLNEKNKKISKLHFVLSPVAYFGSVYYCTWWWFSYLCQYSISTGACKPLARLKQAFMCECMCVCVYVCVRACPHCAFNAHWSRLHCKQTKPKTEVNAHWTNSFLEEHGRRSKVDWNGMLTMTQLLKVKGQVIRKDTPTSHYNHMR